MEIIKVNPKKKNIGIVGYAKEHNYTQLHILIDKRIEDCNSYDVDFKMSNEEVFTLKDLKTTEDGYIIVPLEDTVLVEGNLEIQPIGHQDEAIVKSCVYNAKVAKSVNALQKELEELNPSLADYLYRNTVKVVDALPKNPKVGDIVALRKPVKEEQEENIDYWKDVIINGPDTGFYKYGEGGKIIGVNIDDAHFNDTVCQFGPINYQDFQYDATKNMAGLIGIGNFFDIRYIVRVGSARNVEIEDDIFQDVFLINIIEQMADGGFGKELLFCNCENYYGGIDILPNIWYAFDAKNNTANIATEKDFEYFIQLWKGNWGVADLWDLFMEHDEDIGAENLTITPQICIDVLKQFCSINGVITNTPEEDDILDKTLYIAEKNSEGKIVWKKYLSGGGNFNNEEVVKIVEKLPDQAIENQVVALIGKANTIDSVHVWGLEDPGFITYEKDESDGTEYPVPHLEMVVPEPRIIFDTIPTDIEKYNNKKFESAVTIAKNYLSDEPQICMFYIGCIPDESPLAYGVIEFYYKGETESVEYFHAGEKLENELIVPENGWYFYKDHKETEDGKTYFEKVTEENFKDFFFDWENEGIGDQFACTVTKQDLENALQEGWDISYQMCWEWMKTFLKIPSEGGNFYIAENINGKTSWKEFLSLDNKNIKAVNAVEKLPAPKKNGETIELLESSPIKIDEVKFSDLDFYNGALFGGYDASYDIELNIKDQLLNIEEQEEKFFYSAGFATEDNLKENNYIDMSKNFCIILCSNFADFNFSEDLDEIKKPFIDILLGNENGETYFTYRKEIPKDHEEFFNFNGEGWYYQDDETEKMEKISDPINKKITNCLSFEYEKVFEINYGFGNFGDLDNVKEEIDTFFKIYRTPGLYTVKEKENKKEWQSFVTLDYVNKFIKNDSRIIKSYTQFPIYEYDEDSYDSEEIIIHTNSFGDDYVSIYDLDVLTRTDPRLEFSEEGYIAGFKNSITAQSGVEINGLPATIDLQYLPQNYYGGITFGTLEMGMRARFFVWIKSGIIDGEDIGTALYVDDRVTHAYYAYAKENALVNGIRVDEEGWYIANHSENGRLLKCTKEQLENFVIKEDTIAILDYMTYFDKEKYDNLNSQESLELDYDAALQVMRSFIKFTKRPQGLYKKHRQACWEPLLQIDETLTYKNGKLAVNTTNEVSEDNTLPITSAAVQMQIGNIEELLKTI